MYAWKGDELKLSVPRYLPLFQHSLKTQIQSASSADHKDAAKVVEQRRDQPPVFRLPSKAFYLERLKLRLVLDPDGQVLCRTPHVVASAEARDVQSDK